jgi:hypothetical protein
LDIEVGGCTITQTEEKPSVCRARWEQAGSGAFCRSRGPSEALSNSINLRDCHFHCLPHFLSYSYEEQNKTLNFSSTYFWEQAVEMLKYHLVCFPTHCKMVTASSVPIRYGTVSGVNVGLLKSRGHYFYIDSQGLSLLSHVSWNTVCSSCVTK